MLWIKVKSHPLSFSQVLNDKLEVQCSELSTALHSLTLENTRLQTEHQNNVKVFQFSSQFYCHWHQK